MLQCLRFDVRMMLLLLALFGSVVAVAVVAVNVLCLVIGLMLLALLLS